VQDNWWPWSAQGKRNIVMAEAILTLRNRGSGAKGIDFRPKLDYTEVVFRGAMEIAS
jgi:hypothetical protein